MKFADYIYHHPDVKTLKEEIQAIEKRLQKAISFDEFWNAFLDLDALNQHLSTDLCDSNTTRLNVSATMNTGICVADGNFISDNI